LQQTVAQQDCSLDDAIENIDIGGPTMVRAAAKNHARVTVVVDPGDYAAIVDELTASGSVSENTRFTLATKAYAHTARYDGLVAAYLSSRTGDAEKATRTTRIHHTTIPKQTGTPLRRKPAPGGCFLC